MGEIRTERRLTGRLAMVFCGALACGMLAPFGLIGPGWLPLAKVALALETDPAQATRDLFASAEAGDLAGAQTAVAAGARLNARDEWGMTPVDVAVERGHFKVAHFLLSVRSFRRTGEATSATSRGEPESDRPIASFDSAADTGGDAPPAVPVMGVAADPLPTAGANAPPAADGKSPFDLNTTVAGATLPILGQVRPPDANATAETVALGQGDPGTGDGAEDGAAKAAAGFATSAGGNPDNTVRSGTPLIEQTAPSVSVDPPPIPDPAPSTGDQGEPQANLGGEAGLGNGAAPQVAALTNSGTVLASATTTPTKAAAEASPKDEVDTAFAPRSRPPLQGVTLMLGRSLALGKAPPAEDVRRAGCVERPRGTLFACVEAVDWPEDVRRHFDTTTILYRGPKAIVRYEDDAATRFHAVFPSQSFTAIAAYLESQLGPPTDVLKREIRPFGGPRQANPTLMWQSVAAEGGTTAAQLLELRRFDDARGDFPDSDNGALLLYAPASPTIFPQLSSIDLMLIRRRSFR